MKVCKKCKEISCIGCYERKISKIRRRYYCLRYSIKKIFKRNKCNNDYTWENDLYDKKEENILEDWKQDKEKDVWEEKEIEMEGKDFGKELIEEINDRLLNVCEEEYENIEEYEKVEISIDKIRYSQRRINPLFQRNNSEGFRENIYDVIEGLKKGEIIYGDNKGNLPLISIVIKDNKVYSMDNRRLYCLKEVYTENKSICCIYRKDNVNFRRKRIQAIYESERELGEKNFKYNSVIIDKYAKGRRFIV